jgi:hypothetical protein
VSTNKWIHDYLPNAADKLFVNPFYLIKSVNEKRRLLYTGGIGFLSILNRFIYKKYSSRLIRKYPQSLGKGIILGEGVAKLNRYDYQDIYQKIYKEIKEGLVI